MKIAIASQNRREITGHTGHCRRFWLYDIGSDGEIEARQLLELARDQALHASPRHQPHPLDRVEVLISGGMGHGLRRRLAAMGITAVVTGVTEPDRAVTAWLEGSLEQLAPETAHAAGHGHAHAGGCGCGGGHAALG
ncbi:MAG: NifB/NifX family molybdenum-iron cluster-binding protein [Gammaproteobacteria bacterium]|jgi:predicted Fe-Mo cluster-binding NifX family protein